jgi:UDP-3-O-[3-hydroxymyristoyl] glucosamine N-acyltransferase
MEFTVNQIAGLINGKVEGNGNTAIRNAAKIQEGTPDSIAFLANLKYESYIYTTNAGAVLVADDFVPKEKINTTLIRVPDPYAAFGILLAEYEKMKSVGQNGIEKNSFIHESAQIGENVYVAAFAYLASNVKVGKNCKIYPHAYIGDNTQIGDDVVIFAGAKIYPDTIIGNRCVIHAGAVIGSDGFGFAPQPDGSFKAIPQVGNVILEDDVSIGANTTVDCATMGSTVIESGVKLDNLIQVAHNVKIGKNTVIAALTGISGSTEIGKNCVIAGQVGIVGHVKVADRTTIGAQAGLSKGISEAGTTVLGAPATDIREMKKQFIMIRKLPELYERIKLLEDKLKDEKA